jgi:glycosyltransferase involved in cell wall biosynthesis
MSGESLRLGIVIPERNTVSESFIQAQIDRLSDRTIEIWGSPRPLFSGPGESILSGMPSLLAGTLRVVTRMDRARAIGAVGRRLPTAWYERQVAAYLRRVRAEVVLAEYGPTGVVVMNACARSATPLVVHFHGYDAYKTEAVGRLRESYNRLFQIADRMVAVSHHMEDRLRELGAPPERVFYNPYGVDVDTFQGGQPEKSAPVFVALGRFVEKKAPKLTIQAFAAVHGEEPEAQLVMIGEGPLRHACIDLARDLGIANSVSFPGSIAHDAVVSWMLRARCFVQHSRQSSDGDSEGTPVAILEASSCGLPVVSTRHAGIVEAVRDGESGFLVDEGDVDGMTVHMLRLAREPALAAAMGRAGRQHIEANYRMDDSLGRLRSVLQEAARTGR